MQTHKIVQGVTKHTRVLMPTPAFEALLGAAHPFAGRAVLGALMAQCNAFLANDCPTRIFGLTDPPLNASAEQMQALNWLEAGFEVEPLGAVEGLAILDKAVRAVLAW